MRANHIWLLFFLPFPSVSAALWSPSHLKQNNHLSRLRHTYWDFFGHEHPPPFSQQKSSTGHAYLANFSLSPVIWSPSYLETKDKYINQGGLRIAWEPTHSRKQKNSQLQTITNNSKKNKGMRMLQQRKHRVWWHFQAMLIQRLHLCI